jgi:benzoylformate decarboxylase
MAEQGTVHDGTYDLLRSLGLTTAFGSPGSTFPDDFTDVLGLQEAPVLAMADGFAQSTGKPALVNVHTGAGTGNAGRGPRWRPLTRPGPGAVGTGHGCRQEFA